MRCAWKELLSILPVWMRKEADEHGKESGQELRLRLDQPPQLITAVGERWLHGNVTADDLNFCVNTASRYSPWAAATMAQGYITAPGGHRIGLGGETVVQAGDMCGMQRIRSLCIRIARDFPGLARTAAGIKGSVLIIGPPGSGKTTLLRDLIRQKSDTGPGCVAVVDERRELFPTTFSTGKRTDILSGCPKPQGIDTALRTLGPAYIAVDEITAEADCQALLRAGWCGVTLLATAHAGSLKDLRSRPVYESVVKSKLFQHVVIIQSDKSWYMERMEL